MATSKGQIPFRQKGQTRCIKHKGRQLELHCEKCDLLVCLKCLSTMHKGHDVCELNEITPKKKQDIQMFIDRTEKNDLVQLRKSIGSTDTLLKDNATNFEKLSHKLKTQTDMLKEDLDLLTAQTLSLYDKMEQDNANLIQTYKQDLEVYEKELKQRIKECKQALQHGSNIDIYDTGCEICTQTNLPFKPVLDIASFTPNKNPKCHLELALGKSEVSLKGQALGVTSVTPSGGQESSNIPDPLEPTGKKEVAMYKLLPQTKVLDEWMSPVGIRSLCPTTDGQVWTSDYSKTLTLLGQKGKITQRIKHISYINDISLSPATHAPWVCDLENGILELVSGQLAYRFSTNEEPRCICVTASNHVIVGMTNNICKFTTQGQMVLTTSTTGTGKPLVCSPYRISECPFRQNVAVVDWNSEDDGGDDIPHVIVMDNCFSELFVYRGDVSSVYKHTSHKRDEPFEPYGVAYDSVGNIVIGDCNNNRVLLISGGGEILRVIHTDTDWTRTVGIDREDVLWANFGLNVKRLQYSSM